MVFIKLGELFIKAQYSTEACIEPSRISKMIFFFFQKAPLNVQLGFKYASFQGWNYQRISYFHVPKKYQIKKKYV